MGDEIISVSDAGPFIHLYEIDSLSILRICKEIITSHTILNEAAKYIPVSFQNALPNLTICEVSSLELNEFIYNKQLYFLHAGDCESLYLAHKKQISLIFTDDMALRKQAQRMNLQPVGSVGIILKSYHQNLLSLSKTKELLNALKDSSLFITPAIIDFALDQLK